MPVADGLHGRQVRAIPLRQQSCHLRGKVVAHHLLTAPADPLDEQIPVAVQAKEQQAAELRRRCSQLLPLQVLGPGHAGGLEDLQSA